MSKKTLSILNESQISAKIYFIRGQNVMLDSDLAEVYGVTTTRLNEQVKRNAKKFPDDFSFRLSKEEWENLKSQFARSSLQHGGRRKLPLVFTEHGALQASNVLNSHQAIATSVFVIRAFNKMREVISHHAELQKQIAKIEEKLSEHDEEIQTVFEVIKQLIATPKKRVGEIGFHTKMK